MRWSYSGIMKTYLIAILCPSPIEFRQNFRRKLMLIFKQLIFRNLLSSLWWWKILQYLLKYIERKTRLHIISTIQAIKTISSDNSSLFSNQFFQFCIEYSYSEIGNNFFYFLDQPLRILKFIILALLMKIEILVTNVRRWVQIH